MKYGKLPTYPSPYIYIYIRGILILGNTTIRMNVLAIHLLT